MPERPDDQSMPIDEPYYPPIRGGGPGNGFAHQHEEEGSGQAIPTSELGELEVDQHTHPEHGILQADWTDDQHNFGKRYQHFHSLDGLGEAIWTGPLFPPEYYIDAGLPVVHIDGGGGGGGDNN